MMNFSKSVLVLLSVVNFQKNAAMSLRGVGEKSRALQTAYYSTSDSSILGRANPDAAIGNPLKGLLTSPRWTGGNTPTTIPSSLEYYYIGWDEVMQGLNDFTWDVLDQTIRDAERNSNHVMWRIYAHYPGNSLRVPQFLLDAGIKLVDIGGEVSPQYDDPILLDAMENFIAAFGEKYDGHTSVANVQAGLLGKWGEWHTYPQNGLLSDSTKDKVVEWYTNAFKTTQLQIRNPHESAYNAGIGLHDDSFGYSTLDGAPNGGQNVGWFFWPTVKSAGQTDFWKRSVMGGEVRPEIQDSIFKDSYPAGTSNNQDFMECVETTHATYLFHHYFFEDNSYSASELENARYGHARLGYNFQVTEVAVASASGNVAIDVTVEQVGVAPFYYPLSLQLSCDGATKTLGGVEALVDKGDSKVFSFSGIPADQQCLGEVKITLESEYAFDGKPIRFAQGNDGKVSFELPSPDDDGTRPNSTPRTLSPVTAPVASPVAPPPAASPSASSCLSVDFINECTSTTGCQEMYSGATDCSNQGGGVCYCGEGVVCGCEAFGSSENVDPTCFSGANTVDVQDSSGVIVETLMADLQIGDLVRTANGKFSRVYSFSHIESDAYATYLQIVAQGLERPLEISPNHMLFVRGTPIRAKDVKIGDMVGENKVISVATVQRQGIYAPVSTSGDIAVSGVVASCFVALMDISPAIQHAAAQAVLSPVRLACAANFGICENETYTAGRSDFVWNIIQVVRAASQFPIAVQLAGALLASPLMVAAYAIEQVAMVPLFSSIALLFSVALLRRRSGQSKIKTL